MFSPPTLLSPSMVSPSSSAKLVLEIVYSLLVPIEMHVFRVSDET